MALVAIGSNGEDGCGSISTEAWVEGAQGAHSTMPVIILVSTKASLALAVLSGDGTRRGGEVEATGLAWRARNLITTSRRVEAWFTLVALTATMARKTTT